MVDPGCWQILLVALAGWVNRHQLDVIEYLREENRVLREQLGKRRLHLTDTQRRRLACRGHVSGARCCSGWRRWSRWIRFCGGTVSSSRGDGRRHTTRSRTPRCSHGDPSADGADGAGESDLGLPADPRSLEESWASRRPIDDCHHPSGQRPRPRAGAPDLVAYVS